MLCTPGHTPDHACFELREEGSVFTGDCVLGGSSAVFEDLASYMKSLQRMLPLFPAADAWRIYPGHGPVIEDGAATVREYISHRNAREGQVVAVLRQPVATWIGLSPWGIARRIYQKLGLKLLLGAAWNVEKHLEKLQADGSVGARRLSLFPIKLMGLRFDRLFFRRWHLRDAPARRPDP